MPHAPVDDHGTTLYYEDTGPLSAYPLYTTLIVIHGTGVHGAIFRRMLPFARKYNLRIVLLNRRDYPGSSPLTDTDLVSVQPGTSQEQNGLFLRERGRELASFLVWFVREQNIPRMRTDRDGRVRGGLSLVAWSSANNVVMALLGNLDHLPQSHRAVIEPYLRTYIHYDGPRWAVGYAPVVNLNEPKPLLNPALSEEEKFVHFKSWVSGYRNHPDLQSRSVTGLTHDIAADPAPTYDRMTPEESDETSSRYALFHSEMLIRTLPPDVFARNRIRALFDDDTSGCLRFWKDVPVKMLQCEKSLWEMISVMWELQNTYEASLRAGRRVRRMEFHILEESSHFAHWDEPEKLTKRLSELA